jgi:hypothetical protein
VLAGRVRRTEEANVVLKALEKHIKRKVDPDKLFTCKFSLVVFLFYVEGTELKLPVRLQ